MSTSNPGFSPTDDMPMTGLQVEDQQLQQAYSECDLEQAACSPQNVGQMERLGSTLAGGALLLGGLGRGKLGGLLMTLLGGGLLYRGVTGHCHAYQMLGIDTARTNPNSAVSAQQGVKVERSLTINRSPQELFAFWRDVENLPRVMRHLETVEAEGNRSHWVALGPFETLVEWDAEIFNERENELIAWRSLPGGDIDTAGSIHFRPQSHNRGTIMTVSMKYNPPAGKLGATIASLLGQGLEQELDEDLRRFKSIMEAGEAPTTFGQPQGAAGI